ncbi:MAG: YqaJ viral recombinase family protein [Eubacteriales bacterium]|nr:YqaJ viral recombinase family protein [Eubacteriales bacterium]
MSLKKIILKDRDDWLDHRTGRIGGSEASCIIGCNPYKSNEELWEEKTGRRQPEDISDKPYVRYGTNAEDYLRDLFQLDFPEYKVFYEENNMFLNDKYPFAHASLDGWLLDQNGRHGVLEIKTTNILQSMQKEKWRDRIPENYYAQVLHYLMVTGFDFAILKAQLKYEYAGELPRLETKHYLIERSDVEEDIEYIRSEEERFYRYIQEDKRPPFRLPEI